MSTEYSGNPALYPATVTIPSHGDPDIVASFNDGLSDLADRTAFVGAWRDYMIDVPIVNWGPYMFADFTGTTMPLNYVRGDGTTKPFWSESMAIWVVPGSNNAGEFYIGDANVFGFTTTGGATKWSFGCDTQAVPGASNVILFDHTLHGAGVPPRYVRSSGALASWTVGFLPGTVTGSSQVNDVVRAASGRLVAVGAMDANHYAWTSNDGGVSWTRNLVGPSLGTLGLQRIIIGKSNRLIAWVNNIASQNGNILYYSDDEGTTWNARGSIGFASIQDAVYVPGPDQYVFSHNDLGGDFECVADPVAGTFVNYHVGFAVKALSANNDTLLWCAEYAVTNDYRILLSRTVPPAGSTRLVHRALPIGTAIPFALIHSSEGQFGEFGGFYIRLSEKAR